jgi:hypothetical protein
MERHGGRIDVNPPRPGTTFGPGPDRAQTPYRPTHTHVPATARHPDDDDACPAHPGPPRQRPGDPEAQGRLWHCWLETTWPTGAHDLVPAVGVTRPARRWPLPTSFVVPPRVICHEAVARRPRIASHEARKLRRACGMEPADRAKRRTVLMRSLGTTHW